MTLDLWLRLVCEAAAAGFIAPTFAMLFAVPRNCLAVIAAGGALTRFVRQFLVLGLDMEIVIATFLACAVISLVFIYLGPKLQTPRPVFTVACVIALIPGIDAYTALTSFIFMVESANDAAFSHHIFSFMHSFARCIGIMLAIAWGIAVPPLFFYRYRSRKL